MYLPKTWSQEERRRIVMNKLIVKLKLQLQKIAMENKSNLKKWSLSKNLTFWNRIIGKK